MFRSTSRKITNEERGKRIDEMYEEWRELQAKADKLREKAAAELRDFQKYGCTHTYKDGGSAVKGYAMHEECQLCGLWF